MELRRFNRVPINAPVLFAPKGDDAFSEGIAKDISLGGMFLATEYPAQFGAEVTIHLTLQGAAQDLILPGIVRWTRDDGMGIQFGLIGALDTYAITEVVRRHEEATR